MVDKDVPPSVQALQKLGLPELSVQFNTPWALVLEFLRALFVCLVLLTVRPCTLVHQGLPPTPGPSCSSGSPSLCAHPLQIPNCPPPSCSESSSLPSHLLQ